jgi:hypothetical protein
MTKAMFAGVERRSRETPIVSRTDDQLPSDDARFALAGECGKFEEEHARQMAN